MSHAKVIRWSAMALLLSGVVAVAADAPRGATASDPEAAKLRQKRDEQIKQNALLSRHIRDLQQHIDSLKAQLAATTGQGEIVRPRPQRPNNWGYGGEINRVPFYLIPLQIGQDRAVAPPSFGSARRRPLT